MTLQIKENTSEPHQQREQIANTTINLRANKSLARRVTIIISIILLFVTLVLGSVSYLIVYQNHLDENARIEQLLVNTVKSNAAVGSYVNNELILRDVVNGLLANPIINGVKIVLDDKVIIEQSQANADYDAGRKYPLYSPVDKSVQIASLLISNNTKIIADKARETAFSTSIYLIVGSFILTIIIYLIYLNLLANPLISLTENIAKIIPGDNTRVDINKKHKDDEIGLLSCQVNSFLDAAENADKAKSQFLAHMSHEIRTPITGIIGTLDIASKKETYQDAEIYIKNARKSADNLLVIINDILDFSKIQAGKLDFEENLLELDSLHRQIINNLDYQLRNKEIMVNCQKESDIPRKVIADPTRLSQVLINLLSNAIKFSHQKGMIDINVSLRESKEDKVVLLYSVHDNGIGMSEEQQTMIFDSFQQADGSTTRKYGGTGLGLSITKQLVEMMNGRIWVESELNKGSYFCFTVELKRAQETEEDDTHESDYSNDDKVEYNLNEQSLDKLKSARIIVAEDNEVNQLIIEDFLEPIGQLDIAENGQKVLDLLTENSYDAILMDCMMPVMDGFEATAQIRNPNSKYYQPNIPIIALTAMAMKQDKIKVLESGMNDYLTKPYNETELLMVLLKWIDMN